MADFFTKHRLDFSLLKRLLGYLLPWKGSMSLAIVLIIVARVIDAWIPIKLGWLAQEMLARDKETSYFVYEAFYLSGWIMAAYLFDAASVAVKSWVGSQALVNLRKQVFRHIQKLPVSYFDKQPVGKLLTRVMHDVDQINQMFAESALPLFGSLILFVLILIALFVLDIRAAFLVMALFPIILFVTDRFRNRQREGYEKIRNDVQEINGFVQEHLHGVITIRHFGLEQQEHRKFDIINDRLAHGYLETANNFGFYISANDFLQSSALIGAYLILASTTPFDAGVFFAFSLYVTMIFRPLTDLAERYNTLQSAFAASTRLFEVIDTPEEVDTGESIESIDSIEFRDVWFYYNPEEWVLKGISFKIEQGEKIALVGQTGSGKSTVVSLLLRFYEPQKGEIFINQKPIKHWSRTSLRKACSVTLQDPVIFSGSLEDNVSLFNPQMGAKEVQKALDYVNFPLSRNVQTSNLSVGEMQLLSLARAAAHSGRFLILDEATANIDPVTEKSIENVLKKMMQGRGCLVVAHRLSTIVDATRILVFFQGKIIERGSHNELLSLKGVYEKLYRLEYF